MLIRNIMKQKGAYLKITRHGLQCGKMYLIYITYCNDNCI